MVNICAYRRAAEFAATDQQQVPSVADTAAQPASQQPEPQAGVPDLDVYFALAVFLLYHFVHTDSESCIK